jgi:hypothetical protein
VFLRFLLCALVAAPARAAPSNVKVDLTPPTVTLTSVPRERTTTAPSASLTGLVADRGSGVNHVTCNGVAARVSRGAASCTVPLQPGMNAVVMVARDRAGNVASSGVMITRLVKTAVLRLSPAAHTVPVGEPDVFHLTDEPVTSQWIQGARWTSSNPNVAMLTDDSYPSFKSLNPGTATITATKDGLTAQATVTVSERAAPGDTRWSIPPVTTSTKSFILRGGGLREGTPQLFHVEVNEAEGDAVVRAVGTAAHGMVDWQMTVPGHPVVGDSGGGLISLIRGSNGQGTALLRVGGNDIQPWRYEPDGDILNTPRMATDGTIYFVERGPGPGSEREHYFVAMDAATGWVTGRLELPRNVAEHEPNRQAKTFSRACRATYSSTPATVTQPSIGPDGHAYVQVVQLRRISWDSCAYRDDRLGQKRVDSRLLLIGLGPGGEWTVRTISADAVEGNQWREDVMVQAGDISPDALDGLLLTWDTAGAPGRMLTRLAANGERQDTVIGPTDTLAMVTAGPGKDWHSTLWLVTEAGDQVRAVDVPTLTSRWTARVTGAVPIVGVDHRALLLTEGGQEPSLTLLGSNGTVLSRTRVSLRDASVVLLGNDLIHGIGDDGSLRAVVGPPLSETAYSFQLKGPDPGPTGCSVR